MAIIERAAGVKRAFAAFPGPDQACKNALLLKQCYGDHPLREPGEGLLAPTIRPGCGTPSFHAGSTSHPCAAYPTGEPPILLHISDQNLAPCGPNAAFADLWGFPSIARWYTGLTVRGHES
jgi:hypothetical protein